MRLVRVGEGQWVRADEVVGVVAEDYVVRVIGREGSEIVQVHDTIKGAKADAVRIVAEIDAVLGAQQAPVSEPEGPEGEVPEGERVG